jgi:beta-1,2-mannobiose phosphorylase / 1,2-beta-oligomannan phosphorylase
MTDIDTTIAATVPYRLTRRGLLMAPDPAIPEEAEGVLNPATAWGPDGELYLFPRVVGAGNRSRVGRARVLLGDDGVPVGVERLGVVLDADRGWEHGTAHGGVEDPRITTVPELGLQVMSYVAFGPLGPRPALAVSRDAAHWERLGPVLFAYDDALDTDLGLFPNKDVVLLPEVVPDPDGRPSFAFLHRPMWELDFARPAEQPPLPAGVTDARASIWISYVPADEARRDPRALTLLRGHRPLAGPEQPWERLKIGAGPAPIRTDEGWLLLYHGVDGRISGSSFEPQGAVRYAAGAMLLDPADPSRVLARTAAPLLEPESADETSGTVANVVFPTAIERIRGRDFVFYGMADARIGVAELEREP